MMGSSSALPPTVDKRLPVSRPIWRTLRFRLAVWNATAVLLTALIVLLALRLGVRWALVREIDYVLVDDARDIGQSIGILPPDQIERFKNDLSRMAGSHEHRGWYVKFLDANENEVWATPAARPNFPQLLTQKELIPLTFDGYRIVHHRVPPAIPGVKFIRVGATLARIKQDTAQIDRWVLLAAGAVMLAAPLCGYWLAARAARTVGDIITTASRLRPSHFDERLPIRGTGDELDQLAETVNGLLDRIAAYLNAKRDFLANAAHELRTPLAAIRSSVEVALNGSRSPQEYEDLLVDVIEEAESLEALVNQLLLLSETEADLPTAKFAPFDLSKLVAQSVDMFTGVAEARGVKLRTGRLDRAVVNGNLGHLRQVLNNLLDNAVKYTPSGGSIEAEAIVDQQRVRLRVADTGVGITPEEQRLIFERFFRAESARSRASGASGAGLGLSICQSVVQNHGGVISVDGAPDRGTVFTVSLPLAESCDNEHAPPDNEQGGRSVDLIS